MKSQTQTKEAASIVADAALEAAEKVAAAAKAAVESAAAAAASAAQASSVIGAVAISRIDGLDKRLDYHERICTDRYNSLGSWMKTTFFTLVVGFGAMAFYLIVHHT